MCLTFSAAFVRNFSRSKKNSARSYQKCTYVCMLILSDLNRTWIFSTNFGNILIGRISWKSGQVKQSSCVRTDGRDELTKLIVAFRNISKASKNMLWVRGPISAGSGREQWQDLSNTVLILGDHWGAGVVWAASGFWRYSGLVLKPVQESIQAVCRNFH